MSSLAAISDDTFEPGPRVAGALLRIAALEWQDVTPGLILELAEQLGSYTGTPAQIEFQPDGRSARLLRAMSYTDGAGSEWPVPVDAWLDGASIPRAFWTIIGGPFEGKYREASIVHDHYCIIRTRAWQATHRMFYEAMRTSGVGKAKAKTMYYTVYRFGPRWQLGTTAEAEAGGRFFDIPEAAADSLAADAEAIYVQDLNLEAIETLADIRNAEVSLLESAAESVPADAARAKLLVIAGGSGDADDLRAVQDEAAILPAFLVARFEKKKIRIVACRERVTDFERDLHNVVPRGWEKTGKTWDDVPGAYFPDRKRVVIATIPTDRGRVVPGRDSGRHGSYCLVAHESLHGFDYIGGHAASADDRFRAARTSDLARLGDYERQDGQAGLEETFAESGARFIRGEPGLATDWPNLHEYWKQGPYANLRSESVAVAPSADQALGTAEILSDGTIKLDIRAESDSGAIGHAVIRVHPDESAYPSLKSHIYGPDAREESLPAGSVLFVP